MHFGAYTLPNLTENGNKEKPKKDRGYLDYEDYLMNLEEYYPRKTGSFIVLVLNPLMMTKAWTI